MCMQNLTHTHTHTHTHTRKATVRKHIKILCQSLRHVQLLPIPWTVTHQAPLCGILQARIVEQVTISFSRGPYQPRNQTWISCTAERFFTIWATRKAHQSINCYYSGERVKTQIFIFSYLFAVFSNVYTMMNYPCFSSLLPLLGKN